MIYKLIEWFDLRFKFWKVLQLFKFEIYLNNTIIICWYNLILEILNAANFYLQNFNPFHNIANFSFHNRQPWRNYLLYMYSICTIKLYLSYKDNIMEITDSIWL